MHCLGCSNDNIFNFLFDIITGQLILVTNDMFIESPGSFDAIQIHYNNITFYIYVVIYSYIHRYK